MNQPPLHPVVAALRQVGLQDAPNETWITTRLAKMLPDGQAETLYPETLERCDVVYRNVRGGRTFVELKYAQPYFSQSQPHRDNRANFEKVITGTCVHDVTNKLPRLGRGERYARVGFALVLYYHEVGEFSLPRRCVERFKAQAGLDGDEWHEHHEGPWANPNISTPRCMIEVYYWERDGGVSAAQSSLSSDSDRPLARLSDRDAFVRLAYPILHRKVMSGSDWLWEEWVAEALDASQRDPVVRSVGSRIREHEKPYRKGNYASREQRLHTCEVLYQMLCDEVGHSLGSR